ncbi:MAG TPA: ABC transporter permease [Bryobacteraceae bacterium]|nr:ABC transporter permease [Bryobacteraceae bacterium]
MSVSSSLGHCGRDVRYALRRLRQSPAFTLAAAVTLALGIGSTTAMFSVVDSALLRPLPYTDAERLVAVFEKQRNSTQQVWASEGNFLDWGRQNHVFSDLAAFAFFPFTLSSAGGAERVNGARATWNAFNMLGQMPVLGRGFEPRDCRPGAPPVVILSHGFFERRFGGDPNLIGRAIVLNGAPHTVVGVMPRGFRFLNAPDLFTPLILDPAKASRDFNYLAAVGRLKPGVSLGQAQAEMNGIARSLEIAYPATNQGAGVVLVPVRDAVVKSSHADVLWVLLGAVGFVLLIACVNIANLLLAKAAARQREMAVRSAVGAARGRLAAQLLTESLLLAGLGGALGIALAVWLLQLLPRLVPDFARAGMPEITVNARVLAFTLAVSIFSGVLFGVFPAWRASRLDLQSVLKEGGRGQGVSRSQARFRAALAVLQVALSLVLLAGAGLMLRSLSAMRQTPLGFRGDRLLTMRLAMAENHFAPEPLRVYYRRVLESAGAIPGVEHASLSVGLPVQGATLFMPFWVASQPRPVSQPNAPFEMVSAGFFHNLGIALLQGRAFTERDKEDAPRVAIVNQAFVKRYLPGEDPIGKRLLMQTLIPGTREAGNAAAWEIVGVCATVRDRALGENKPSRPEIYVPLEQSPWPGATLLLRTRQDPLSVAQAARQAMAKVDSEVAVTEVKTMDQIADDSLGEARLRAGLIGSFALVALLMAALGIYALISYSVQQSTHDLGVRMALGADRAAILRLVVTQAMRLTAGGLVLGLAGALALTRLLSSLLFQVAPTDPLTLAAVSALLAAVALLAGLIPALRASRLHPMTALRAE